MNVLVVGGAGFVGCHLIDSLIENGHNVTCVDNYSRGKEENISHLVGSEKFSFHRLDATNIDELSDVFKDTNITYVFQLAANSDIQASSLSPLIEYRNTYSTTFAVLECMRRFNVKKLFFSSTSAVYGDMTGQMVSESNSSLKPISYYGAAKLGAEAMIHAYSFMNDISALIFRFPNVIGSRLTHGVIYDFIMRLKDDPSCLKVLGDGNQTKPYMHISDLISGIIKLIDIDDRVAVYNIGVNTRTTVTRIAEIVIEQMGLTGIPINYTGGKEGWRGDVPEFAYNLDKIHETGWRASMTSDEAVRLTVQEAIR